VRVEVVERVPSPDHIEVGIEHDDHIAQDIDRRRPLHAGENLFYARQNGEVAVGQSQRLVVERIDRSFSENLELLIDASGVGFAKRNPD